VTAEVKSGELEQDAEDRKNVSDRKTSSREGGEKVKRGDRWGNLMRISTKNFRSMLIQKTALIHIEGGRKEQATGLRASKEGSEMQSMPCPW